MEQATPQKKVSSALLESIGVYPGGDRGMNVHPIIEITYERCVLATWKYNVRFLCSYPRWASITSETFSGKHTSDTETKILQADLRVVTAWSRWIVWINLWYRQVIQPLELIWKHHRSNGQKQPTLVGWEFANEHLIFAFVKRTSKIYSSSTGQEIDIHAREASRIRGAQQDNDEVDFLKITYPRLAIYDRGLSYSGIDPFSIGTIEKARRIMRDSSQYPRRIRLGYDTGQKADSIMIAWAKHDR